MESVSIFFGGGGGKINSHRLFFTFLVPKRIENNTYENDDDWDGIYLQPGMNTGVLLEREFKSFMPKPYSECDIDHLAPSDFQSDLYKLINLSPYQYCQVYISNKETHECNYLNKFHLTI